jgi:hypothetical protein
MPVVWDVFARNDAAAATMTWPVRFAMTELYQYQAVARR